MQKKLVEKLSSVAFNTALLLAAIYLFHLSRHFQFDAREGQLGPGFWPEVLLALVIVLTSYDIVVRLVRGSGVSEPRGILAASPGERQGAEEDHDVDDSTAPAGNKRYPFLLLAGCVMTVAYVFLLHILGFTICTVLYLVGFMYAGRYRRHGVIWMSSVVGTFLLVFLFIKVVYVSLPTGVSVFENVSLAMYRLLGVS